MNFQRCSYLIVVGLLSTLIAACGGGGGSSDSNNSSSKTVAQDFVSQTVASNAITFGVQQVPSGNVNTPYVSVNVCEPGTTKCQTINNVLLDTGSTGLRIFF